ncbi:MAG: hypothetical protein MZV70_77580 [Desulfobacterales bacterium]|nr:hypothetical protein [Desulfobacterales bacterium]
MKRASNKSVETNRRPLLHSTPGVKAGVPLVATVVVGGGRSPPAVGRRRHEHRTATFKVRFVMASERFTALTRFAVEFAVTMKKSPWPVKKKEWMA